MSVDDARRISPVGMTRPITAVQFSPKILFSKQEMLVMLSNIC